MTSQEIIDWIQKEKSSNLPISIPNEIFEQIDEKLANIIAEKFASDTLIHLPMHETEFFEWLRENDRNVWDDLWSGVEEKPYIVSIALLPLMVKKFSGYPICDLLNNDNYYFTEEMIVRKTSHLLLETLREKFLRREPLTVAQALLLEISANPVDIWHFAYYHKLSIDEVKQAVRELVEDNLLLHFKKAEELAEFVQF